MFRSWHPTQARADGVTSASGKRGRDRDRYVESSRGPGATARDDRRAARGASICRFPTGPTDALEVIEQLARDAEPGLTQMGGGRYFGFVDRRRRCRPRSRPTGSPRPGIRTPACAAAPGGRRGRGGRRALAEGAARHPAAGARSRFVTGCQMAHATALAAARHHVLAASGYDVERDGLIGAPPIRVVAGAKRHGTLDRALRLRSGSAPARIRDRPGRRPGADARRRAAPTSSRDEDGPTIVCAQAGEVNTGASTTSSAIADAAEAAGAWLHVDGAFGLWAAAARRCGTSSAGVGARRLVGDRRAQVAQRPLRLRHRLLRPPRRAPRGAGHPVGVPPPRRARRGPRPARLEPGALAARARLPDLRGAALARPQRRRRARRAHLRPGARARRGARRAARLRDPERRRPEPGAVPLRGRRGDRRRSSPRCRRAARRGSAARSGTAARDPALRLELAHERGGRRAHGRRVRVLPLPHFTRHLRDSGGSQRARPVAPAVRDHHSVPFRLRAADARPGAATCDHDDRIERDRRGDLLIRVRGRDDVFPALRRSIVV